MERSSATKDEISFMCLDKQQVQASLVHKTNVQDIHERMVRFQRELQLKPHHSFVYALYMSGETPSDCFMSV
jgi:hypothetical protein